MLSCADTLLVIVDIQEKLVRAMHAREELLLRAQQLGQGARVLSIPVGEFVSLYLYLQKIIPIKSTTKEVKNVI